MNLNSSIAVKSHCYRISYYCYIDLVTFLEHRAKIHCRYYCYHYLWFVSSYSTPPTASTTKNILHIVFFHQKDTSDRHTDSIHHVTIGKKSTCVSIIYFITVPFARIYQKRNVANLYLVIMFDCYAYRSHVTKLSCSVIMLDHNSCESDVETHLRVKLETFPMRCV